jgi:outer membrane cobalamin receptor
MRRIFITSLASIVLSAVGARADNSGDKAHPKPLPDSVVVTADRFGEPPSRSIWPVSSVSLNSELGQQSFQQVLDGRLGIDIRETSGLGSIATLSSWGMFNRHLLLLYNGRPVKDYSLGGFNLADFSPDEFERIELLKGPQSALYGSDAVGGVVNLISPSALVDRIRLITRVGTFHSREYRVDASRAFGKFGVGLFGETGKTRNGRPNSGSDRNLIGARGEFLSADGRHHFTVSGRYFQDSIGLPGPVPDPTYTPVYGNSQSTSLTQRQQDENYSTDLSYRFYDAKVGEAQVDAFWEKKNLDYHMLYNYQSYYYTPGPGTDSSLNIDSVDVLTRSIYNKRSSGISGRFLKEMGVVRWSSGIDWLSGSLRATGDDRSRGTNILGPSAPYDYTYNSYSYWAQGQNQFDYWGSSTVSPVRQLDLSASGRIQFIHNRKAQPSYNLGTLIRTSEHLRLKAGYGYSFRVPSIADQFADDIYTSGNIHLDPETSHSFILTAEGETWGKRLTGSITYFNQRVTSLIQYVYEPLTFLSVPRNVDRFQSHGFDFSAALKPTDHLSISFGGVVQRAEQTTGNPDQMIKAYYVPNLKWRADITRDRIIGYLSLSAGVAYTSDRYLLLFGGTPKSISEVYEFNAELTARINPHVSVTISGWDLTDRKRPDQLGYTMGDKDFPSPGRRFLAQLKLSAF